MAFYSGIKVPQTSIGDVHVDCAERQRHGKTGTLTEHAVDSGTPVSDHYRVDPDEVEIQGIISNTPLTGIPGAAAVNSFSSADSGDLTPSQIALQTLESYFDNAEIIEIKTRRKEYTDMVLTSLTVEDEARTAGGLFFTIRARKIRIVSTEEGEAIAKPAKNPKDPAGQKKKEKGKATKQDTADADPSLAKQALDTATAKIGSFFQ